MTIIAERGLFVRLLVQSGKFEQPDAEALADALDAAAKDPATQADLAKVQAEVALLRGDIPSLRAEMLLRFDALSDKLTVRMFGSALAVAGPLFAALRLT